MIPFYKENIPTRQLLETNFQPIMDQHSVSFTYETVWQVLKEIGSEVNQYNVENVLDSSDDDQKILLLSTMRTKAASVRPEF